MFDVCPIFCLCWVFASAPIDDARLPVCLLADVIVFERRSSSTVRLLNDSTFFFISIRFRTFQSVFHRFCQYISTQTTNGERWCSKYSIFPLFQLQFTIIIEWTLATCGLLSNCLLGIVHVFHWSTSVSENNAIVQQHR